MVRKALPRKDKVQSPSSSYGKPQDIVTDSQLSPEEKKQALNTWEQDARQLLTASNEGMPGPEEGLESEDHHRLGEVVRAKDGIGEHPRHKPSH